MSIDVVKVASFSDGELGGNPAGVYISAEHPSASEMQQIAADVGFSETAFAQPEEQGWRVRYFSPESEVPFCGHATIALGAVLAKQEGKSVFDLRLNEASITVEGFVKAGKLAASLQSPETKSELPCEEIVSEALELFGYSSLELASQMPPSLASAGANHLIIGLNSRQSLSSMEYDLDAGRQFMNDAGLVTVMFVYSEGDQLFHSRNPFASGGVYEDPATGAASAAFAGYLRDIQWNHDGAIDIVQGEDMGCRSLIRAELSESRGSSIRVSGSVRFL